MIIQFASLPDTTDNSAIIQGITPNRFFHDQTVRFSGLINTQINSNVSERQNVAIGFKFNENSFDYYSPYRQGLFITTSGKWAEYPKGANANQPSLNGQLGIEFSRYTDREIWARSEDPETKFWSLHFMGMPNNNNILDHLAVINMAPQLSEEETGRMILPRFTVSPEISYSQMGEDLRGYAGQPYGRAIRQLKELRVNFARVQADAIDELYARVGTAEPHWVAPYPEAVTKFPPFWAALTEPPKFTKRGENGWYFNTSLSWREAY